jgi:hypothetical protein
MKLMSPMGRYHTHLKIAELSDEVEEVNQKVAPCGGKKRGFAHFDAEANSKVYVAFKTVHPDIDGNCTIRLGAGLQQSDMEVLKPQYQETDKNGMFPCGREQSNYDGALVKLPANYSCEQCVLQVEW